MKESFTRKTFAYFEEAATRPKDLKWFERNQERYEEDVKRPFSKLIKLIDLELGDEFPDMKISPAKICRPVYPENYVPVSGTLVRSDARAHFSERQTSKFEWNPEITIGIGAGNCFIGVGLFRPSARQLKLLRPSILQSPKALEGKKFREVWGDLIGEKWNRLPKDFDPEVKGADYLWHKQFYFQQSLNRKEVMSREFSDRVIHDLTMAAPFLSWLRESVGVYERPLRESSIFDQSPVRLPVPAFQTDIFVRKAAGLKKEAGAPRP